MRTPLVPLAFAALLFGVCGCNRSNTSSGSSNAATTNGTDSRPIIALVVKTLNNPYFIEMQQGAEKAAKADHVQLLVQAAERESDVERQMQIIENLIQRKVSVLVITPSGSREIVPVIVKANQANIPVIIVDTRADGPEMQSAGAKIAAFIGSDNYMGGKLAGEYLTQKLNGTAKLAVLEGIPGHETGDARLRGFHDALAGHPGMEIVASQPANWERDQGYNVFQNILQAHPDINGLFAASDLMALGATEAIAAAKKTGQIAVVGFDAQPEAREAIKKGSMAATVAQNPATMGEMAVDAAVKVLAGQTVTPEFSVPIELIK